MARSIGWAGAVLALTALSACGKSNTANTAQSAQPAAPPQAAAPPTLTDAQKKALVAQLPVSYQSADLSNGEAKFAVCKSCHTNTQGGADMVGPNLWGLFGRKAGAEPNFAYSDDMKNAGWTWDADRLDNWIANPKAVLPGTKMTFVGLNDPNDRRDVIAYLKVSTSPPPTT
jgi:cytochrome c